MPRVTSRLTALAVSKAKKPGLYGDGGGLYLQVTDTGSKSWLYRFMLNGRARAMGLGPSNTVTLAAARQQALECRQLRLAGIDPIEARNGKALAKATNGITFKEAAEQYIKSHETAWRNPVHHHQWRTTLETYVYPKFGSLPVREVGVAHVMKVLDPIWRDKTETASRLRGRIEAVLDWAKARGYRQGENPARWRGHLENLLPNRAKVRRVRHHPALPYLEIRSFMAALREHEGTAARALELLILTATRTSETVGARWDEIDLKNTVWTLPADRTKSAREHRIPLSRPAVALLKDLKAEDGDGEFVFPGYEKDKPLSNMALLTLLKRMKRSDVTAHGFRSTFRDWAAEQTDYPREVAEMALGHVVRDKVEAAYRRGDLFDKRRRMMEEWAKFCGPPSAVGKKTNRKLT